MTVPTELPAIYTMMQARMNLKQADLKQASLKTTVLAGTMTATVFLLIAPLQLHASDATPAITVATATDTENSVIAHGETLHQQHCYKCHGDEVYKRDNRRVKSMDALRFQVRRCQTSIGAAWFDEDNDAVVQFLNTRYYKF